MTLPTPPGWYPDPGGRALRYWEGERWADHTLPEGATPPSWDDEPLATPARPPRRTSTRVMVTIALFLATGVLATLAGMLVTKLTELAIGPITPAARHDVAQTTRQLFVTALAAWAATKVSYRWFDFLFLLIPLYGLFWIFRIAWRVSYLPYRDWMPRYEEASHWRQVTNPTSPGALLYLASPPRQTVSHRSEFDG